MLFAARKPLISLLLRHEFSSTRWLRSAGGPSLGATKPVRPLVHASRSGCRYTPEEDEKIVQGYNQGQTPQQIAIDIKRTAEAVKMRFRTQLAASPPRQGSLQWNAADDKILLHCRRKGEFFKAVAIKLNRTWNSVRSRYYALLPSHARPKYVSRNLYTPSEDLALLRLRDKEQRSFGEIGRLLGRPWTSIRFRYRYLSDPHVASGTYPSGFYVKCTPLDDAKIVRMKELEGASFPAIADELGRTTRSVMRRYYSYLRNERYIRPKRKVVFWTESEDRRLIELRIAGATWKEIAAELSPRSPYAARGRHTALMDKQSRIAGPIREPSSLIWDSTL